MVSTYCGRQELKRFVKTWYDIVELRNHTKVFSDSDTPHQNVKHLEMHNQLKEVFLTSQSGG